MLKYFGMKIYNAIKYHGVYGESSSSLRLLVRKGALRFKLISSIDRRCILEKLGQFESISWGWKLNLIKYASGERVDGHDLDKL